MNSKITLVLGGSGSGKSAFAESLLDKCGYPKYYLATMEPFGEAAAERISRHRALRAGKGFETIERYRDLESLVLPKEGGFVLLETLSAYLADVMFAGDMQDIQNAPEKTGGDFEDAIRQKVMQGIRQVALQCTHLVIVSDLVFGDGILYQKETACYQKILSDLHKQLCQEADCVYEVRFGRARALQMENRKEMKKPASGLKLYIGGIAQGQRELAYKENYISIIFPGKDGKFADVMGADGIDEAHLLIRRMLTEGRTEEEIRTFFTEYYQKHENAVLIFDEIGCGIVPIDPFETRYREVTGRILQELSEKASEVTYVICGLPERLKP